MGYAGIWYFNNFPILFGNYVSDLDIELPSFAYTYQDLFIGASGEIDKPVGYYPWLNYAKTDNVVRHYVNFTLGVPFDPQNPVYTIVVKPRADFATGDELDVSNLQLAAFPNASPLQGAYVSDLGAYGVFTEVEYAQHYLNSAVNDPSGYLIVQLPGLQEFLHFTKRDFPFIDVGINPGRERYFQGYFLRTAEPQYLKNTHGVFELVDGESFKPIPEPELLDISIRDNIDQPNTFDPTQRGLKTTVKHPLKRILRTTQTALPRREAESLVKCLITDSVLGLDEKELPEMYEYHGLAVDSFLVFGFDKVSGDHFSNHEECIPPFVFDDVIGAILFFYNIHFPHEKKLRRDGYYYCQASRHYKGSGDDEHELHMLKEHQRALEDLLEDILIDGYKVEHGELLKAYINRSSLSLELEACSYLADIALFDESLLKDYLDEHEDSNVASTIAKLSKKARSKNSGLELDEKIQNKIRQYLCTSYRNLSAETLCILESAVKQFSQAEQRLHHDFSGISMKLCKAFERELKTLVFDHWKKLALDTLGKDELKREHDQALKNGDQTVLKLTGYALKRNKLELGPMKFIMKQIQQNPVGRSLECLFDSINGFKNRDFLLSEEFVEVCDLIATKYRNGGVHEKIVNYEICKEAMEHLLTDEDNYLRKLAAV